MFYISIKRCTVKSYAILAHWASEAPLPLLILDSYAVATDRTKTAGRVFLTCGLRDLLVAFRRALSFRGN